MKILHTYCLNYNIGDYALGIGVRNLLRNYLDVDLIGITNIQGRYFDEYYINEVVNKKYDLLIIGGGGIIHGAHWPNGWFWLIKRDLIKSIKIPFVIYGVGNNYFNNEPPMPKKAIVHLKETFEQAIFFSVRNDGSYERLLEETGIKAFEVPDPGFHVNLNMEYERKIKEPYVLIQLANDKPEYRFRSPSNRQRFIQAMRHIIKKLAKTYRVILAPHVFEDVAISREVSDGVLNCEIWNFGYLAFDHTETAVGYYKYADFVLAMRGHGQILPIGFNTPVISLQNHPKHVGLMEKLELQQYNINILDVDFKDKLNNAIKILKCNNIELLNRYKAINIKLFDQSSKAFETIKERIDDFR